MFLKCVKQENDAIKINVICLVDNPYVDVESMDQFLKAYQIDKIALLNLKRFYKQGEDL